MPLGIASRRVTVLQGEGDSKLPPMGVLTEASVSKQNMNRIPTNLFFILALR